MNKGLLGQDLTLAEELKATTYKSHLALQGLPFFQALVACQLPLESYVGQLRALAIIHSVLEKALEISGNETISSLWRSEMGKLPLLQKDLAYFDPRVVADIKESVEVSLKIAENIRMRSLAQPVSLLGYLYVLEGSTLGSRLLAPQYARAFLLEGGDGMSYLNNYGPETYSRWKQYQKRMNALIIGADMEEQITTAAREFFEELKDVFQALYPVKPESLTHLVTSINPEAGTHPIPSDEREVKAAISAADLCWERFPYFEWRYGERGRRFAKSDGAWLATLYQYDPLNVAQQVQWLGRVLATRGMPRVMLQVHLEILYEELIGTIPEKRDAYEKLLNASRELCEARRKYFSDEIFCALSTGFDAAVGNEWSEKLKDTGTLLVSAVADEKDGIVDAVKAIESWLTDSARFPRKWIQAVQDTILKAQDHIRKNQHPD